MQWCEVGHAEAGAPLPAAGADARDAQVDEAGGEESKGAGWGTPPGRMRPGGRRCGG